jgi:hypothetical protein
MEAMAPWLLMIIAALIAVCVALYYQARQIQSEAGGTQRFIADELRDAESGLVSALERIQRMDSVLSAREKALAAAGREEPSAAPVSSSPIVSGAEGVRRESLAHESVARTAASDAQSAPHVEIGADEGCGDDGRPIPATPERVTALNQPPTGFAHGESRALAVSLAVAGLAPLQIARELGVPVGEVELALALGPWNGPTASGTSAPPPHRWH